MMLLGTPRHRRPSRNRTSKSSVHGSAAGHDWVRPEAGQGGGCEARRKPRLFFVAGRDGHTDGTRYLHPDWLCE